MNTEHTKGVLEIKEIKSDEDLLSIYVGMKGDWRAIALIGNMPNGDIQFSFDEAKANAELIVTAVNNYYPMLEALKMALPYISDDASSECIEMAGHSPEDAYKSVSSAIENATKQ